MSPRRFVRYRIAVTDADGRFKGYLLGQHLGLRLSPSDGKVYPCRRWAERRAAKLDAAYAWRNFKVEER